MHRPAATVISLPAEASVPVRVSATPAHPTAQTAAVSAKGKPVPVAMRAKPIKTHTRAESAQAKLAHKTYPGPEATRVNIAPKCTHRVGYNLTKNAKPASQRVSPSGSAARTMGAVSKSGAVTSRSPATKPATIATGKKRDLSKRATVGGLPSGKLPFVRPGAGEHSSPSVSQDHTPSASPLRPHPPLSASFTARSAVAAEWRGESPPEDDSPASRSSSRSDSRNSSRDRGDRERGVSEAWAATEPGSAGSRDDGDDRAHASSMSPVAGSGRKDRASKSPYAQKLVPPRRYTPSASPTQVHHPSSAKKQPLVPLSSPPQPGAVAYLNPVSPIALSLGSPASHPLPPAGLSPLSATSAPNSNNPSASTTPLSPSLLARPAVMVGASELTISQRKLAVPALSVAQIADLSTLTLSPSSAASTPLHAAQPHSGPPSTTHAGTALSTLSSSLPTASSVKAHTPPGPSAEEIEPRTRAESLEGFDDPDLDADADNDNVFTDGSLEDRVKQLRPELAGALSASAHAYPAARTRTRGRDSGEHSEHTPELEDGEADRENRSPARAARASGISAPVPGYNSATKQLVDPAFERLQLASPLISPLSSPQTHSRSQSHTASLHSQLPPQAQPAHAHSGSLTALPSSGIDDKIIRGDDRDRVATLPRHGLPSPKKPINVADRTSTAVVPPLKLPALSPRSSTSSDGLSTNTPKKDKAGLATSARSAFSPRSGEGSSSSRSSRSEHHKLSHSSSVSSMSVSSPSAHSTPGSTQRGSTSGEHDVHHSHVLGAHPHSYAHNTHFPSGPRKLHSSASTSSLVGVQNSSSRSLRAQFDDPTGSSLAASGSATALHGAAEPASTSAFRVPHPPAHPAAPGTFARSSHVLAPALSTHATHSSHAAPAPSQRS